MNPQDLITQYKDPNEVDVEVYDTKPSTSKPPRRSFCSLFCCGSYDEDDKSHDKKDNKAIVNEKKSKGNNSNSASDVPVDGNYPDRTLINSPRYADDGTVKPNCPWRDDHLLPPAPDNKKGMKCLVLDLDETLVHSSFKPVDDCDFIIPVEIENITHKVYVSKRPGVDAFMKRVGEIYEVVVFTASLAKYADPVLDLLDIHKVVDWRLFRESCSPFKGSYVKDMGRMGRDLKNIMIIDNSPHSFAFNPESAIPIESWFSDKNDIELTNLLPILEKIASPTVDDCRDALKTEKISGVEALKREFQDSEDYSSSGEESSGYDSETDSEGSQSQSEPDT